MGSGVGGVGYARLEGRGTITGMGILIRLAVSAFTVWLATLVRYLTTGIWQLVLGRARRRVEA